MAPRRSLRRARAGDHLGRDRFRDGRDARDSAALARHRQSARGRRLAWLRAHSIPRGPRVSDAGHRDRLDGPVGLSILHRRSRSRAVRRRGRGRARFCLRRVLDDRRLRDCRGRRGEGARRVQARPLVDAARFARRAGRNRSDPHPGPLHPGRCLYPRRRLRAEPRDSGDQGARGNERLCLRRGARRHRRARQPGRRGRGGADPQLPHLAPDVAGRAFPEAAVPRDQQLRRHRAAADPFRPATH